MPGLKIVVETGDTPDGLRRVEQGSLDAGLITLPRTLSGGLTRVRLRRDEPLALLPETSTWR